MAEILKHSHKGRIGEILDYLLYGNELSSSQAVDLFTKPRELNLRNKISTLKKHNWPIDSREETDPNTNQKYKVYFIDFSRLK